MRRNVVIGAVVALLLLVLAIIVWAIQSRNTEPPPLTLSSDNGDKVTELEEAIDKAQKGGAFPTALQHAEKILEIRLRFQPRDHWKVQDAQRRVEKLRRVLQMPEAHREKVAAAYRANELGYDLDEPHSGRHTEAEKLFREAIAGRQEVFDEEDEDTAESYNNLGLCLDRQGRHEDGTLNHRIALDIWKKVLGSAHPLTSLAHNNLASSLKEQGHFDEAEEHCRLAIRIRKDVLGPNASETAQSYNTMAAILWAQGRLEDAYPYVKQALDRWRAETKGKSNEYLGIGANNLAVILDAMGRYAEAERYHTEAGSNWMTESGDDNPLIAGHYANWAANQYAQGRFDVADRSHRKALEIRVRFLGIAHPQTVSSYTSLGTAEFAQGRLTSAMELLKLASDGFETARLRTSSRGLARTTSASDQPPMTVLAAVLARSGRAVEAWQYLEASLGRGLLDELTAQAFRRLSDKDRANEERLIRQIDEKDARIMELAKARGKQPELAPEIEKLKDQRDTLQKELAAFEKDLRDRFGVAAGKTYELQQIQASLPPDTAVVAWLDVKGKLGAPRPNEHWACLLRHQGVPLWVEMRGSSAQGMWTADDDQLPEQLRIALSSPLSGGNSPYAGLVSRLAAQRILPLEPHLRGREGLPPVRQLIVLPSRALAGIPVDILMANRTVTYAPSGTIYAWIKEKSKLATRGKTSSPRLLAIGDPAFKDERYSLPASRHEVTRIGALVAQPTILRDDAASEDQIERLLGELDQYDYLHFATHVQINPYIAMQSAFLLSDRHRLDLLEQVKRRGRIYIGRITAQDVLRAWKLNASLVTLSACESGLGPYSAGEGYLGFAQAFFLAGARSLLLSLWEVDDRATALLMVRFYENLLGKRQGLARPMSKTEALKEAKRWLRDLSREEVRSLVAQLPVSLRRTAAESERGKPRPRTQGEATIDSFAHPYYWAGFILIGDPE